MYRRSKRKERNHRPNLANAKEILHQSTEQKWYQWAQYTVTKLNMINCSPSPMNKVIIVPNPYDYKECATFIKNFCHLNGNERPFFMLNVSLSLAALIGKSTLIILFGVTIVDR